MDEIQVLELVEFYEDMIEKQDEIIVRQSRFIKNLATELSHLRNMLNVEAGEDERLDAGIIEEVKEEYEGTVKVPFFHGGKIWYMREIDLFRRNTLASINDERRFVMRKLVDWLIGGNLDRLLKALGGEE